MSLENFVCLGGMAQVAAASDALEGLCSVKRFSGVDDTNGALQGMSGFGYLSRIALSNRPGHVREHIGTIIEERLHHFQEYLLIASHPFQGLSAIEESLSPGQGGVFSIMEEPRGCLDGLWSGR